MDVTEVTVPDSRRGEVGARSLEEHRSLSTRARLVRVWDDLKAPVLVFLGMRVFLTLAVYLVAPIFPISSRGGTWSALPEYPLLDVWARWDSGWYASIVEAGYRYSTEQPSNVAFLPAYPLAVKAITLITGNVWMAGMVVANLAYLAALIVLFKLVRLKYDRAVARRAVLYTAAFPAAFFFYSMYSESVYLLSVVLAFYLWERRKDWPAGALGAVAALTRPMGMLLFLSGAAFHVAERGRRLGEGHTVELLTSAQVAEEGRGITSAAPPEAKAIGLRSQSPLKGLRWLGISARALFRVNTPGQPSVIVRRGVRSRVSWNALSLLLIPLALAGFLAYSYLAFGEPLAFLKSRTVGWNEPLSLLPLSHRELAASILDGSILTGQGPALRLLDAGSAIAFLALSVPVFKRLGPAYGLYSLGSLAMPLVVTLDGLTRYVSVIFPAFMVLASWRPRTALVAPLVGLSMLLMGLMASMFARWYFVG